MRSSSIDNHFALLLTATINPGSTILTARSDPQVRLKDYKQALQAWLSCRGVRSIVVCENSGADLSQMADVSGSAVEFQKQLEFIAFNGQSFPPNLGKGYGEMGIIEYALKHSEVLKRHSHLLKVTGRYYVRNVATLIDFVSSHGEFDIVGDFSFNLTRSDSRLFYASVRFLRNYLIPLRSHINDSEGIYFEHVLARAIHTALGDGLTWSLPPRYPDIIGVSATSGLRYNKTLFHRLVREIRYQIKRRAVARI